MQTLCQSDQAAYLALQSSFHEISNLLTLNISITRRGDLVPVHLLGGSIPRAFSCLTHQLAAGGPSRHRQWPAAKHPDQLPAGQGEMQCRNRYSTHSSSAERSPIRRRLLSKERISVTVRLLITLVADQLS